MGIGIIINNINKSQVEIIAKPSNEESSPRILVQVTGEVLRPGIYEMSEDDRINDVINLSGGFTSRAETSTVNLVAKISDGMVIVVNKKNNINPSNETNNNFISLNNASLGELMKLDGIGEAKARNIISYREINGGFKTIEEITKVNGISDAIFKNIKDKICP